MDRSARGIGLVKWAASLALASVPLLAAGCGDSTSNPDAALENATTPPTGTLIETKAKLKAGADYSTVASADNRARGQGDALIVGVAAIDAGAPQMRLLVDGQPIPSATRVFGTGDDAVATVSASRELPVGDSEVTLEGRAGGGEAALGARSLVVFTPAAADELPSSDLVNAASVEDQHVGIEPTGDGMGSVALTKDASQVLLLVAYRSPDESSASPEAFRTEVVLGGEAMDQVADATMPEGKLGIYYSGTPASAGDQIDLVGFTVAGRASVHATTLAVCPCGIDPSGPQG